MKNPENERFIEVYNLLREQGKVRSKADIARVTGKIPQIIYDIFAGKIKISSEILVSLEAAYGVNKSYILFGEGKMLTEKKSAPVEADVITMSREVFEQISRLTETVLSQQRTIEELVSKKGSVALPDTATSANVG